MKAISIKDPHASRILRGEKTREYRKWQTNHRGHLLICCSANPKTENAGKALCIVTLKDIKPIGDDNDLFEWILSDLTPISPFPVRGQMGLFSVQI